MGRALSAGIPLFWLGRLPIQLFYYDPEARRRNLPVDIALTLATTFLGAVMGLAAWGGFRHG